MDDDLMARKRDISPDLWLHRKVLALPWSGVGFYCGLISLADDAGRLVWDDRELAARIVGTRPDATLDDVRLWMAAAADVDLMRVYGVGGRDYALHPNWGRHQYINRPKASHLPGPDGLIGHGSISDEDVNGNGAVTPRARPRVAPRTASGTASVSVSAHPPTPLTEGGMCGEKTRTRVPVNPHDARIDAILEGRP